MSQDRLLHDLKIQKKNQKTVQQTSQLAATAKKHRESPYLIFLNI